MVSMIGETVTIESLLRDCIEYTVPSFLEMGKTQLAVSVGTAATKGTQIRVAPSRVGGVESLFGCGSRDF